MAESAWAMKILSGVHVGAEALLSEEAAVIGRDEGCDFVLDDGALAERHFSLQADNGCVCLSVLDSRNPVCVDGQAVTGSVGLEAYQVVSVGGLALAVGPAEAAWPKIEPPAARGAEEYVREGAPAAADASIRDARAMGADDSESEELLRERNEKRVRPGVRASVIVPLAMVLVGGIAWLLTPKRIETKRQDTAEVVRQINAIASRYGAVIDVKVDDANATVRVTGNTDTEHDRLSLVDELAGTGVRATVHLDSSEQLAEFASAILDQSLNLDKRNRVSVSPVADAPGELLVSGYVEGEAGLSTAKALLERDVREARGLTYRIQTKADRLAVLRQRLAGLGLADRLRVQELEDRIGLFGPLHSKEELATLAGLARDFNAEFESRPRLKLEGTGSFLGVSTIDLDIRAVVLGERLHVITQGGETHEVGSKIDGDYVIDTITEHYMILEKTGELESADEAGGPELAYFIFEGD